MIVNQHECWTPLLIDQKKRPNKKSSTDLSDYHFLPKQYRLRQINWQSKPKYEKDKRKKQENQKKKAKGKQGRKTRGNHPWEHQTNDRKGNNMCNVPFTDVNVCLTKSTYAYSKPKLQCIPTIASPSWGA